jgi:hypothetical protein
MKHKINRNNLAKMIKSHISKRRLINRVGEYTIKILKSKAKKFKILPIAEANKTDLFDMYGQIARSKKPFYVKKNKLDYEPIRQIVKNNYNGFITDDRIYINEDQDDNKIMKAVVHEINHFVNNEIGIDDDVEPKSLKTAISEYRARLAEYMFENTTISLNKNEINAIKNEIKDTYLDKYSSFDINTIPDLPDGIIYD